MMKRMDLFCSSFASTAITSCVDPRSTSRRSTKRYTSVGRKSQLRVPCSSQSPVNPKKKHRKSSSEDKQKSSDLRRKSSVKVNSLYGHSSADSSTRYLLNDVPFIDWVSESDKITAKAPAQHADKPRVMNKEDTSFLASSKDQVVVLRVSLHCKACEGKVRKHISKMEGVTSFSIDMEAKKVTIMGHVTPSGVLASVSKVKHAQLWPSPPSSSLSSLPSLTTTTQWST